MTMGTVDTHGIQVGDLVRLQIFSAMLNQEVDAATVLFGKAPQDVFAKKDGLGPGYHFMIQLENWFPLEERLALLKGADSDLREAVAVSLRGYNATEAVNALLELLHDPNYAVQIAAAKSIGNNTAPHVTSTMLSKFEYPLVSSRLHRLRVVLISNFKGNTSKEVIKFLHVLMNDVAKESSYELALLAAKSLQGNHSSQVTKLLLELLNATSDTSGRKRIVAATALEGNTAPKVKKALLQAITSGDYVHVPEVLETLLRVLNERKHRTPEILAGLFEAYKAREGYPAVQMAILNAIAQSKPGCEELCALLSESKR